MDRGGFVAKATFFHNSLPDREGLNSACGEVKYIIAIARRKTGFLQGKAEGMFVGMLGTLKAQDLSSADVLKIIHSSNESSDASSDKADESDEDV